MNLFLFVPSTVAIMLKKKKCRFEALLLKQEAKTRLLVSCGVTKCEYCIQSFMNFMHCHVMPSTGKNMSALQTANQARGYSL